MPSSSSLASELHKYSSLQSGVFLEWRRSLDGTREEITVHGRHPADIDVERSEESLTLYARFPRNAHLLLSTGEIMLCVRANAARPIEVVGIDAPPRFAFLSGTDFRQADSDTISMLHAMAESCLDRVPPTLGAEEPACESGTLPTWSVDCSHSRAQATTVLAEFFRRVARDTLRLMDPVLAAGARRLSKPARLWWLEKAQQEPRIAQSAYVTPGPILLAYAESELVELQDASQAILDDVTSGCPTRDIAKRAYASLAYFTRHISGEAWGEVARTWAWLREVDDKTRKRAMFDQAFLLRIASPRTNPSNLLLPGPLSMLADDVPRGLLEYARWDGTIRDHLDLLAPREDDDVAKMSDLSQFVSRHYAELHRRLQSRRVWAGIDRIIQSVRHGDVKATKARSVERVLRDCERVYRAVEFPSVEMAAQSIDAPIVSNGYLETWSDARVDAERIRSVGELIRSGERARNCLGTRVHRALAGAASYYTCRVDGRLVWLEILHDPQRGPRLGEVAGYRNRVATSDELFAMESFLRAVGVEPI